MASLVFYILVGAVIYWLIKKRILKPNRIGRFVFGRTTPIRYRDNYSPRYKVQKDPEEKGDLFEQFVVKRFNQNYFTIKEWRGDKYIDGLCAQSNMNPDLEIEYSDNQRIIRFAVECKYRSSAKGGYIEIAKERQIHHYKAFAKEKNIKVFVVLGLGGDPDTPSEMYIIPLDAIVLPHLEINTIRQYKRYPYDNFYYNLENQMLM